MTLQTSKLRRLFQALSVLSVIACMLLVVMWVRSYWWRDSFFGCFSDTQLFHVISMQGRLEIAFSALPIAMAKSATLYDGQLWNERISQLKAIPFFPTPTEPDIFGFGLRRGMFGIVAYVPFWFLLLTGVSGAVVFYRKETWRFSLRTLLVATTLIAMVLGMIAYAGD